MALIECPECGNMVSDQEDTCIYCGCPLDNDKPKDHFLPWLGIFILALFTVGVVILTSYQFKIKKANKQEEAMAYQQLQDYNGHVNEIFKNRNESVNELNECSTLLMNVWRNAILQYSDPTTDPFTCPNGYFEDDFNIALDRLYEDPDFSAKLDTIETMQLQLRTLKKNMPEVPEGLEDYNNLIIRMIDNHVEASMLLLNWSGTYNEISEQMGNLSEEGTEILMELKAYQ